MEKVTLIYCFRDRDLARVKLSLDSLTTQRDKSFKVIFVDYGSEKNLSSQVKELTAGYPFVRYVYNDTRGMFWNRSHALNSGIRIADTEYVFTADIDLIFHPGFTEKLNELADRDKAVFFSVTYLPKGKLPGNPKQETNYQRSKDDALGLGLIPTKALDDINGYDEFYQVWGKEDNDIGHRLKATGLKLVFIPEIWIWHYYHEPIPLQREFFPKGLFFFVTNYCDHHSLEVKRNPEGWGKILRLEDRMSLNPMHKFPSGFIELKGRSHYFRYRLETGLESADSGSTLAFSITDIISEEYQNARLQKVTGYFNHILQKLRIPFVFSTKYQHQYEDIYTYRDELFYFLVTNKKHIRDYAFEVKGKTLKVVIFKK